MYRTYDIQSEARRGYNMRYLGLRSLRTLLSGCLDCAKWLVQQVTHGQNVILERLCWARASPRSSLSISHPKSPSLNAGIGMKTVLQVSLFGRTS
jgi:hypothetical protein